MIDFIGDLHGHADKLEQLFKNLNNTIINGSYCYRWKQPMVLLNLPCATVNT